MARTSVYQNKRRARMARPKKIVYPKKPYTYRRTRRSRLATKAYVNARTGGFLGIEKKFYDTSVNGSISACGTDCSGGEADPSTVNCISAPAQGDGESNRDGKNIRIKSIYVAGKIEYATLTGATQVSSDVYGSIALVLDTQTNGAQLNSEDVFSNPAAALGGLTGPLRNLQYSRRFKVLRIKNFTVKPMVAANNASATTVSAAYQDVMFKFSVPMCDIPVTFTGTTAGVSNVVDNSLHIILLGSQSYSLIYNSRIRFVG